MSPIINNRNATNTIPLGEFFDNAVLTAETALSRSAYGYRMGHQNLLSLRTIPCYRIPEHGSIFRQILEVVCVNDLLSVLDPCNKQYLFKKYGYENIEKWLTGKCSSRWESRWIDEVMASMVLVVDEGQKRVSAFSTMLVEDMQVNIGALVHSSTNEALAWHQHNTRGRTAIMHKALVQGTVGHQVILVAYAQKVGSMAGLFGFDPAAGTQYIRATDLFDNLNK